MLHAEGVNYLTAALSRWAAKQPSPLEVEARRRWRRSWLPEERVASRRQSRRLRRSRRAGVRRGRLRRLSLRRVAAPRSALVDLGAGLESDDALQQDSLLTWCTEKFSLPVAGAHCQAGARAGSGANSCCGGVGGGSFSLGRLLALRPRTVAILAKSGPGSYGHLTRGGWRRAGNGLGQSHGGQAGLVAVLSGPLQWPAGSDRHGTPSWDVLILVGLPKDNKGSSWLGSRWVAKTSVLAKHWHRFLVAGGTASPKYMLAHTFGFQKSFRTGDVVLTVATAISTARQGSYGLVIIEADIQRCFDELDHVVMLSSLICRGWPPAAARSMIEEYTSVSAEAVVASSLKTPRFPWLRGGRAGGTETPQLLVELLQDGLAELVLGWRKEGRGFKVAGDQLGSGPGSLVDLFMWADNAWLSASSEAEALGMFRELSEVLYGCLRLRWKASSLKLMRVHPEGARISTAEPLVVPATWLGVLLCRGLGAGGAWYTACVLRVQPVPVRAPLGLWLHRVGAPPGPAQRGGREGEDAGPHERGGGLGALRLGDVVFLPDVADLGCGGWEEAAPGHVSAVGPEAAPGA